MKLTKQACDKLELLATPHTYENETLGNILNPPGYPEIYYDADSRLWYDNGGEIVNWEDNGYKTLWDLVKAIDEIRSKEF